MKLLAAMQVFFIDRFKDADYHSSLLLAALRVRTSILARLELTMTSFSHDSKASRAKSWKQQSSQSF
jgi:hypothetical protein